ncbi:hypothetical protein DID88_008196 [Monilinia fructigena]|uniref:Mediator of RNA polymerase II transcription subunit 5 n=1 Tax=Monilinia fructigena TaxID=38457 RepID=A0A395J513_9HELO|nr:hypothetical protein DID88_008196 [Monilinia fructigena]
MDGNAGAVSQAIAEVIKHMCNNKETMTLKTLCTKNLEQSLRWLQRAEPERQDIEPVSKVLESNLGWERRGASKHTELELWTATSGGGLAASIKHTIVILVQWGLQWGRNPGMHIMPASYTHRQILTGMKILGAKRLLNTIIEEVKTQTEAGNGSVGELKPSQSSNNNYYPHNDGLGDLNGVMGDTVMGDGSLGPTDSNLNIDDMGAGGDELMMMGGSGHGGDLLDAFGGDGLGDGMGF